MKPECENYNTSDICLYRMECPKELLSCDIYKKIREIKRVNSLHKNQKTLAALG